MPKRYRYDLSEEEYQLLDRYRQILGLRSHTEALRVLINSFIPVAIANHQKALSGLGLDIPTQPTEPTRPIDPPKLPDVSPKLPESPPDPPKAIQQPTIPIKADQVFGDLLKKLG